MVLICLCASVQAEPSLKHVGSLRWEQPEPWFGGWSGIEITDNGSRMTVISDRGQVTQTKLQRTNGRISGVGILSTKRLGKSAGEALNKKAGDAEGLAIADNGNAFVSFEHRHRIMQANLMTGRTSGRINLPFKDTMGENSGVEALAISADGTLFAMAEQAQSGGAPFPLYAYKNGAWRVSAHIPRRGPFRPVGADFDTKGRLWLLERAVTPLGFRSRIRLFIIDPNAPSEHTLLTTIPARYDNLEGISVWNAKDGQMHVTLISDDNFMHILRTQIVEYTVAE
jgi:hypothetical protein